MKEKTRLAPACGAQAHSFPEFYFWAPRSKVNSIIEPAVNDVTREVI